MSPENVERYGRTLVAWERGDLEAWLDDAQDSEMHTSGEFLGFEPVYRGRDGLRAFWDLMRALGAITTTTSCGFTTLVAAISCC